MTRQIAVALLLALGLAFALRWPNLDQRPMHNDEAVNAIKFGQLWQTGDYRYDPNEHHGPTLYYATVALGKLSGAPRALADFSESRLRWVSLLFGVASLVPLAFLADALGRRGTMWAALFLAVSPAMVFYSQYYIHEMLLVFFTLLAIAAGWRYCQSRKLLWALLAGSALGLMHATKETFVITLFAGAAAVVFNLGWNSYLDASRPHPKPGRFRPWHLVAAGAVWLAVALLFFTSFFTNARGPWDSVQTYLPWLNRAAGASPHLHPWHFYLHRLLWFHAAPGPVWTELLIFLLAIVASWAGFARNRLGRANASFVRFLTLFALVLTAVYSALAYKTPWCLLSFWLPIILLAGIGAAVLLRGIRPRAIRWPMLGLLLAGAAHLGWQAWAGSSTYAADRRNPYVYAQTSRDLLHQVERIESLAAVAPDQYHTTIKVITQDGDCWPLPWYLRRFDHVVWYDKVPDDPFAPIMIVSASLQAALDEKKTHLMVGLTEFRPQTFLELYVQKELWQQWLAAHPPKREE